MGVLFAGDGDGGTVLEKGEREIEKLLESLEDEYEEGEKSLKSKRRKGGRRERERE